MKRSDFIKKHRKRLREKELKIKTLERCQNAIMFETPSRAIQIIGKIYPQLVKHIQIDIKTGKISFVGCHIDGNSIKRELSIGEALKTIVKAIENR